MQISVEVLVYISIFVSGTSFILAGDIPQKELSIRSIDANPKSNSEQPLRVNLTCKSNPISLYNISYRKVFIFLSFVLVINLMLGIKGKKKRFRK